MTTKRGNGAEWILIVSKGSLLHNDDKMEEQVILRLPPELAAYVRETMSKQELPNDALEVIPAVDPNSTKTNTSSVSKTQIDCSDSRICEFKFMGKSYPAKLCDLPCIIEAQKTFDRASYYKSGDICQILIVRKPEDPEPPDLLDSGLTPPTHMIREKRFRKHPYKVR
jgi:transcription initiation factor TFIID subunit 7